jgi:hypothetical protein
VAVEFLLVDADTHAPLWHADLSFGHLIEILEAIPIDDLPSCAGMPATYPERKAIPFFVAGPRPTDDLSDGAAMPVKGVGIVTPDGNSPRHVLSILRELRSRLADTLWDQGLRPVPLAYHPQARASAGSATRSEDPRSEEMLTYGTRVRVGLPAAVQARFDLDDLQGKVCHYGPGLSVFSLAAPFCGDGVWHTGEGIGKSCHIGRRALDPAPLAIGADRAANLEYGALDSGCRDADVHAYLLLWLALLLDDTLAGRGSPDSYRRDLDRAAKLGFDDPAARARAGILLEAAPAALQRRGLPAEPLETLGERLRHRRSPADDYLDWYARAGALAPVLEKLAVRPRVRI